MVVQIEDSIQNADESEVDRKKKKRSSSWMTSLRLRWISQISFIIITIYIGWSFYLFVKYCESGGVANYVARPPGIEAF